MKTQTEIDTADAAADAADEWRREVARCKAITERYKAAELEAAEVAVRIATAKAAEMECVRRPSSRRKI